MSEEIQLNKPLYKDESADAAGNTVQKPRPPRPNLFGRVGAVVLDLMLLHLVFTGIAKVAGSSILSLGGAAPWIGLLIGYLYFAICASHITLGRTLGKLICRVQVCDIAGPDLPVGRAFLRTALLMWPLAIYLALGIFAEGADNDPAFLMAPAIELPGSALVGGWFVGNLFFAVLDPFKRTLYDRLTGALIINAEVDADETRDYIADARDAATRTAPRGSYITLAATLLLFLAAAAAIVMYHRSAIVAAGSELRTNMLEVREVLHLDGYGQPTPRMSGNDRSTTTPVAVYAYEKRGRIDVEELKRNERASSAAERVLAFHTRPGYVEQLKAYLNESSLQAAKGGEPVPPPEKIGVEIQFAELADLFWAREAFTVYTMEKIVDLPSTITEQLRRPSDQTTTATIPQ